MYAHLAEVSAFKVKRQVSDLKFVQWIRTKRSERHRQKELWRIIAELRGAGPEAMADYGFDAEHIALAKSPQQVLHPGIVVMNVLFKS
jgi:hypothetical protein